MYLENLVFDAREPQRLGRFWEAVVGAETLTDAPGIVETRLNIKGEAFLDLCFQQVAEPISVRPRVDLHVNASDGLTAEVDRLQALGAQRPDGDSPDASSKLLADPEGNIFHVTESVAHLNTGALAAIVLDSAHLDRDAAFWSWLTGWSALDGLVHPALRHSSAHGPLLKFIAEPAPKDTVKNRRHLDVRLVAGQDPDVIAAAIVERGGREVQSEGDELPWRLYQDPSGNEFCVLPAT